MNIWAILGLVLLALVVLGFYYNTKERRQAIVTAKEILERLEYKYYRYMDKRTAVDILGEKQSSQEAVVDEALIILKPEVESLINLVNRVTVSDVNLNVNMEIFSNLLRLTEKAFQRSTKNKDQQLTQDERLEFYDSIRDAVMADLSSRKLSEETRNS